MRRKRGAPDPRWSELLRFVFVSELVVAGLFIVVAFRAGYRFDEGVLGFLVRKAFLPLSIVNLLVMTVWIFRSRRPETPARKRLWVATLAAVTLCCWAAGPLGSVAFVVLEQDTIIRAVERGDVAVRGWTRETQDDVPYLWTVRHDTGLGENTVILVIAPREVADGDVRGPAEYRGAPRLILRWGRVAVLELRTP